MGCSAIRANSAAPISCSATQSGLRTLTSGSRDPKARAAAVRIEVREGNPLASILELSIISALRSVVGFECRHLVATPRHNEGVSRQEDHVWPSPFWAVLALAPQRS